jgi:hypothetical protein
MGELVVEAVVTMHDQRKCAELQDRDTRSVARVDHDTHQHMTYPGSCDYWKLSVGLDVECAWCTRIKNTKQSYSDNPGKP